MPEEYVAEKIAEGLSGKVRPGDRVLLARAEEAREILLERLRRMNAVVEDVAAYKTVPGQANKEKLIEMLKTGGIDAVTFTSSSTVRNFMQLIDGNISLLQGIELYTIGPITSHTVREYGLTVSRQAETYTIQGLLQALMG